MPRIKSITFEEQVFASVDDLASHLGIKETSVRSRLYRDKKKPEEEREFVVEYHAQKEKKPAKEKVFEAQKGELISVEHTIGKIPLNTKKEEEKESKECLSKTETPPQKEKKKRISLKQSRRTWMANDMNKHHIDNKIKKAINEVYDLDENLLNSTNNEIIVDDIDMVENDPVEDNNNNNNNVHVEMTETK